MNTRHLVSSALAVGLLATASLRAAPIPEDAKINGFAIGLQCWTFNRFTVMEAIEKTAQAGGKVIEFFPGQQLSKEQPDAKWDHNASDEMIAQVKAKLEKHGVKAVNYGVVAIPSDEAGARQILGFAKKLGLYAVTTESVEALPTLNKLVAEYDVKVGIHNHPKQPDNPNYKVWDPAYVLSVTKDLDPRIGAACDTGHWIRSGLNPVDGLKTLQGRLVSVHLKDLNKVGTGAEDVPYGTGVANIPALLNELKRQNFLGNISIEYETLWENNVPAAAQCIGFVRGYSTPK
jgi:sugar phosphate isomerase/epimerase